MGLNMAGDGRTAGKGEQLRRNYAGTLEYRGTSSW